jgi:hypothetical protein
MNKFCIFICVIALSTIGGWLGSYVDFMTGFICSGVGSLVGVYVGWRINRDYLE